MLPEFSVYHINAPGQEYGAPKLDSDYIYPTIDELAEQVQYHYLYLPKNSCKPFNGPLHLSISTIWQCIKGQQC